MAYGENQKSTPQQQRHKCFPQRLVLLLICRKTLLINFCDPGCVKEALADKAHGLQACLDYVESLQELEGILGSDTCSQIRNDPRLKHLLLGHQTGELGSEKLSMGRQRSASCACAAVEERPHRSTI